jgi:hypothetical protein
LMSPTPTATGWLAACLYTLAARVVQCLLLFSDDLCGFMAAALRLI